jgi:hypothetical protein
VATPERWHVALANKQLFKAIEENSPEGVQAAIDAGSNQNDEYLGNTPLTLACQKGYLKIAELLLKNGADTGLRNRFYTTPLMMACYENITLELVQLLLKHKANPNVGTRADGGVTAFMVACLKGPLELIKLLLEHGAKPNLQNHGTNTALQWACENDYNEEGHPKIVTLLLSKQVTPLTDISYGPATPGVERRVQLVIDWANRPGNQPTTQQEFDHFTQYPGDFTVLLFRTGMIKKLRPCLNQNQRDILVTAFFTELRGDSRQIYFDADACIVAEQLREWVREDLWEREFARMDMQFTKTYLNMKACQKMQTKLAQSLTKNPKMRDLTFGFDLDGGN